MGLLNTKSKIAKMHPGDVLAAFTTPGAIENSSIGALILDTQGGGDFSSPQAVKYINTEYSQVEAAQAMKVFTLLTGILQQNGRDQNSLAKAMRWAVRKELNRGEDEELTPTEIAVINATATGMCEVETLVRKPKKEDVLWIASIGAAFAVRTKTWEDLSLQGGLDFLNQALAEAKSQKG